MQLDQEMKENMSTADTTAAQCKTTIISLHLSRKVKGHSAHRATILSPRAILFCVCQALEHVSLLGNMADRKLVNKVSHALQKSLFTAGLNVFTSASSGVPPVSWSEGKESVENWPKLLNSGKSVKLAISLSKISSMPLKVLIGVLDVSRPLSTFFGCTG